MERYTNPELTDMHLKYRTSDCNGRGGPVMKHQKCLIETAKGCKMNFVPELEKVLSIIKETCKPGSEINKENARLQECLKTADKDQKCANLITRLEENDERTQLELQREACRSVT
ncbi:hypothetical protein TNCV_333171 [Trichonephila clavipes]|nr:hypothetical protein TNCV_333171 [Trichonephila clavipes]